MIDLPRAARVLDVGCGPGKQTGVLAREGRQVVAMDLSREYLDEVRASAPTARALQASMFAMPFAPGSFDAIWSEGAIYILGFERGLREWRALLRPGGYVVVSELSWLQSAREPAPKAFWAINYPAMQTVAENISTVARCGYTLVDYFVLPPSSWWTDYYSPLSARIAQLRADHAGDAAYEQSLGETAHQIDLYRRYSHSYGYVFYVMR